MIKLKRLNDMEYKEFKLELKASDDAGNFEGYAAVYNNVDDGYDVIEPGAFDEIKTTKNGELRIAVHHDMRRFIGAAVPTSDAHGLHVKGKVNLAVSWARDTFELMRSGIYDAMSVGYSSKSVRWEVRDDRDIRIISSATLWEASVLPFGMNSEAKIIDVKSDKRLFESHLRSNMGLSQREAKHLAAVYFAHRDGDDEATAKVEEIKAANDWLDKFLTGI